MSDERSLSRAPRKRMGHSSGVVFAMLFSTLSVVASPSAADRTPVLVSPGPWDESPIAPGKSNYRLVIEYSAAPGVNAIVSLQGWKRLLPTGENLRAEFAIEDEDGSPYIIRHWRAGREQPDSVERPRGEKAERGPEVTLTAPEGFRIHRAFVQALGDADHGEVWAKVSAADAGVGEGLYRDQCMACHGNGEKPGLYPGLPAWKDHGLATGSEPHALWRALNAEAGPAAGHPRLTDEESYHVVRYLRERLLPPDASEVVAADLPRGKVLPPPAGGRGVFQSPLEAHGPRTVFIPAAVHRRFPGEAGARIEARPDPSPRSGDRRGDAGPRAGNL